MFYIVKGEIKYGSQWRCRDNKVGELLQCPIAKEADIPIRGLNICVYRGWEIRAPRCFRGFGAESDVCGIVMVDERHERHGGQKNRVSQCTE
jgi:hypothetical protein